MLVRELTHSFGSGGSVVVDEMRALLQHVVRSTCPRGVQRDDESGVTGLTRKVKHYDGAPAANTFDDSDVASTTQQRNHVPCDSPQCVWQDNGKSCLPWALSTTTLIIFLSELKGF